MMRLIYCTLFSLFGHAQSGTLDFHVLKTIDHTQTPEGIQWVAGLSWTQILQKAKSENKYVFVDCFTTWCAPCKRMDMEVYPNKVVGAVMNEKFICVKSQMDITDKDDEKVKAWYKDAKFLENQFKIDAYPTLLFFSSEGKLVHRVSKGMNVDEFLDLVSTALDPKKQYFTRLAEYQNGVRDTAILKQLAKSTKEAGDKKLASKIAEEYLAIVKPESLYNKEVRDFVREFYQVEKAKELALEYIDRLRKREIYTIDNIEFIRLFTTSSRQRGFKIFYYNAEKVNKIMDAIPSKPNVFTLIDKGDYSQSAVRSIIYREKFYLEILKPASDSSKNQMHADWVKLKADIQREYPQVNAEKIVIDAKVTWYGWKKNWSELARVLLEKLDLTYKNKSLVGKTLVINNLCWDIFQRSSDTSILNGAVGWMEKTFEENPKDKEWANYLDTYANLLYKIGKKQALEWQAKAFKLSSNDNEIKERWEKMNKGMPTWPIKK